MLHYFDLTASLAICTFPRKAGLQNCAMRLSLNGMKKNIALFAAASTLFLSPAAQKLGIVDLQQDGTKYFDLHHTPDDTLGKFDKAELRQNVAAWVAALAYLANYEGELKPELAQ